jgi:hypothetical protein
MFSIYFIYISVPSYKSVGRFLKVNGFVHKKCQLKPPLTDANRLKRLAFANRWMNNGVCTLDNVIWTDETRVASHPNNRRISVWTNQSEAPIQVKMHSGGNSVMFWGLFFEARYRAVGVNSRIDEFGRIHLCIDRRADSRVHTS